MSGRWIRRPVRPRCIHSLPSSQPSACSATKGEKQRLWLDRLDAEIDNFRAAIAGALEGDPEAALSLAANLCPLWKDRDYRTEGRQYLALARTGESIEAARALRFPIKPLDED